MATSVQENKIIIQRPVDATQQGNLLLSIPNEIMRVIFGMLKDNNDDGIKFGKQLSKLGQVCIKMLQIVQSAPLSDVITSSKIALKAEKELKAKQLAALQSPMNYVYYDWPGASPQFNGY